MFKKFTGIDQLTNEPLGCMDADTDPLRPADKRFFGDCFIRRGHQSQDIGGGFLFPVARARITDICFPFGDVYIIIGLIHHGFEVETRAERGEFEGVIAFCGSDDDHLVIITLIRCDVHLGANVREKHLRIAAKTSAVEARSGGSADFPCPGVVHDPDDTMRIILSDKPTHDSEGCLHPLVSAEIVDGVVAEDVKDNAIPWTLRYNRGDALLVLKNVQVQERIVSVFECVNEQAFVDELLFFGRQNGAHGAEIAFESPTDVFRLKQKPMGALPLVSQPRNARPVIMAIRSWRIKRDLPIPAAPQKANVSPFAM
jgi:hypothetical protein